MFHVKALQGRTPRYTAQPLPFFSGSAVPSCQSKAGDTTRSVGLVLTGQPTRFSSLASMTGTAQALEACDRAPLRRCVAGIVPPDDVEDVVQIALLKAHRAAHTFRGDCALSSWLWRIARLAAFDWQRRQRRRGGAHLPLLDAVAVPCDRPHLTTAAATRQRLERCLAELTPAERAIVAQRADGLTFQEIALEHGVTANVVKLRAFRARRRLIAKGLSA